MLVQMMNQCKSFRMKTEMKLLERCSLKVVASRRAGRTKESSSVLLATAGCPSKIILPVSQQLRLQQWQMAATSHTINHENDSKKNLLPCCDNDFSPCIGLFDENGGAKKSVGCSELASSNRTKTNTRVLVIVVGFVGEQCCDWSSK